MAPGIEIVLEPCGEGDLSLLEGFFGHPAMMEHPPDPESSEQIAVRHGRHAR
jgi:hypothetical protein